MFRNRQGREKLVDVAETPSGAAVGSAPNESDRLLEQRLREAVAGGKFDLRYQPIFSVAGGDLVGVEALLRWESDAGRVSPGSFLPILEATGLVNDVGPWVLAKACQEARPWIAARPGLLVTVNVSPQQLEAGFADWVLGTLSTMGFPADHLCLELLQTTSIADPTVAWGELRRLKMAGVHLFLHDFGSLGSSIADLRRFTVDAVKIDPGFVSGLGRGGDDDAVVAAVIALAHALGMQTVAEGVETPLQLERLQALGCDLAQGFHLMEPVRAAEVTAALASEAAQPLTI